MFNSLSSEDDLPRFPSTRRVEDLVGVSDKDLLLSSDTDTATPSTFADADADADAGQKNPIPEPEAPPSDAESEEATGTAISTTAAAGVPPPLPPRGRLLSLPPSSRQPQQQQSPSTAGRGRVRVRGRGRVRVRVVRKKKNATKKVTGAQGGVGGVVRVRRAGTVAGESARPPKPKPKPKPKPDSADGVSRSDDDVVAESESASVFPVNPIPLPLPFSIARQHLPNLESIILPKKWLVGGKKTENPMSVAVSAIDGEEGGDREGDRGGRVEGIEGGEEEDASDVVIDEEEGAIVIGGGGSSGGDPQGGRRGGVRGDSETQQRQKREWRPETFSEYVRMRRQPRRVFGFEEKKETEEEEEEEEENEEEDQGRVRMSLLQISGECFRVILSFIGTDPRPVLNLRLVCLALCRLFDVTAPEAASKQRFTMGLTTRRRVPPTTVKSAFAQLILPSFKIRYVRKLAICGVGDRHLLERFFGKGSDSEGCSFIRKAMDCQRKRDREHEHVMHRRMDWRTQGELRVQRISRAVDDPNSFENLVVERFPCVTKLWIDRCSFFGEIALSRWPLTKLVVYECSKIRFLLDHLHSPALLRTLKIENSPEKFVIHRCGIGDGGCLRRFWLTLERLHLCNLMPDVRGQFIVGFKKLEVLVLHGSSSINNSSFDSIGRTLRKIELDNCSRITHDLFLRLSCVENVIVRRCCNISAAKAISSLREVCSPMPQARIEDMSLKELLEREREMYRAPVPPPMPAASVNDEWDSDGDDEDWTY